MCVSDYFDITLPNQYSFLGYYQYCIKQTDFTFSFQKEANTLRKNLETILNNSSNSEIIKSVKSLKETFKNHQARFQEVDKFWNNIENEYLHEKLSIEEKELQLDEWEIAHVITRGASKATATVMENVDAKLKFNQKHSLPDTSKPTDGIKNGTVKKIKTIQEPSASINCDNKTEEEDEQIEMDLASIRKQLEMKPLIEVHGRLNEPEKKPQ
nr:12824_t:CDS:2 [Entrophospora candida]